MGIFKQMRDRRLLQALAAYLATGWVVLEVVGELIERGLLPEVAFRVGLAWYVGGAIATLVLSWQHGRTGRQAVTRIEVGFLTVLGLFTLGASGLILQVHATRVDRLTVPRTGPALDQRRIAVLYFGDATGTDSLRYVADALTEGLIKELSLVPSLDVISENGALQFRDSELSLDSLARITRAGTIVTGSVRSRGDELIADFALADGESGAEFRRESIEAPVDDPLQLATKLSATAALMMREWIGEQVILEADRARARDPASWALVQRARRETRLSEQRLRSDDLQGARARLMAADSLATYAESLDSTWTTIPVLRARIARRLAQLSTGETLQAERHLDAGLAQAERALRIDSRDPAALEIRGIIRYLRWALSLENNAADARVLLQAAEADLEASVRFDPTRAQAWSALSVLRAQHSDPVGSKIAARRAYEEDAYVRAAEEVLWILYTTSYDLEQFPDAVQYCDEGRRRFPGDARFRECELWLMASGAEQPDVERAWDLFEQYVSRVPPHNRDYARARGGVLVGGVLAQLERPDSADAVMRTYRSDPSSDPAREVAMFESIFRIRMGHRKEAFELLELYLTANPEHRADWASSTHWWWRPIRNDPEFRMLMGSP